MRKNQSIQILKENDLENTINITDFQIDEINDVKI